MNFFTDYDPWLVALSFVVATLAALTALDLAGRLRATKGTARYLWLCGGALAMGSGIWSMHFIGMLAVRSAGFMQYDLEITLVSMLAAVLASAVALLVVCAPQPTHPRLLLGGLIMGVGVCLMHYLGMEAMQTGSTITYKPLPFLLSIAIALVASTAALWLSLYFNPIQSQQQRPRFYLRLLAALVMAIGIAGMHYTGMAAAEYEPMAMSMSESGLSPMQLAIAIAVASGGIMAGALLMAVYDNHLNSRASTLTVSLQEANRELKSMVSRDPLTRLANRLVVEQRLAEVIGLTQQADSSFAVIFVDLDRFKSVNDSMGHHVGDQLLKVVAKRLQASVRDSDVVARVGGDEFLVVTDTDTSLSDSEALAKRITTSLAAPFQIGELIVRISCSVGISLYPEGGSTPHDLIVHADAAMYHAKDMGRNNQQVYEAGMSSVAERRNILEQRLRLAIDHDELTLAYQPQVDVKTGKITGVEALLRWHDCELGEIGPAEIIPIAEDTGLILPIGEWVLRTACLQAVEWRDKGLGRLAMAVNLSAIQLNHKSFVSVVEKVLNETGLPPGDLEFELTETAIMHDPDNAQRILHQLSELGVTLSIDDFGTGYSNLSQLKRFPIHRLKVDRSFTSGVVSSLQDAAIVKAVFMLAQSLELDVVAEGVETDEQLDFIRKLNGQQYQGHLYSKAISANKLENLLQAADRQHPAISLV